MSPTKLPAAFGLNVTKNFPLAIGASVSLVRFSVKRAFDGVTFVMKSAALPVFVTVRLSSFVVPTTTLP